MKRIITFIVVTLVAKVIFGDSISISFPSASESILFQLVQWGASIMLGGVVATMEFPINGTSYLNSMKQFLLPVLLLCPVVLGIIYGYKDGQNTRFYYYLCDDTMVY